jgi:hypothetical protein
MPRKVGVVTLVFALAAAFSLADDKKPTGKKTDRAQRKPVQNDQPRARGKHLVGRIVEGDSKQGVLVLAVRTSGAGDEDEVKIRLGKDTKFLALIQGGQKEYTVKEALRSGPFKKGTYVEVVRDAEGHAQVVKTGYFRPKIDLPKPVPFSVGKIKKVDADQGTLLVTVKKGSEERDVRIKAPRGLRFILVYTRGGGQMVLPGHDALRGKYFKEGAEVKVFYGTDSSPKAVMRVIRGGKPEGGQGTKPAATKGEKAKAKKDSK